MNKEIAKESVELIKNDLERIYKLTNSPALHKAISIVVDVAEQVLNAKDVPEKKEINNDDRDLTLLNTGYNSAIDAMTPLLVARDLEIKELKTVLEAWHTVFGTTQLTHASCRLETAEREVNKLNLEIKQLLQIIEGGKKRLIEDCEPLLKDHWVKKENLPSEEEIQNIISEFTVFAANRDSLAKAIADRLGREGK